MEIIDNAYASLCSSVTKAFCNMDNVENISLSTHRIQLRNLRYATSICIFCDRRSIDDDRAGMYYFLCILARTEINLKPVESDLAIPSGSSAIASVAYSFSNLTVLIIATAT